MEKSKELIYGLNDRPPIRETIFAALQHLLAIFVAIITPPLIISSALKFDLDTQVSSCQCLSSCLDWLPLFSVVGLVRLEQGFFVFKERLSLSSVQSSEQVC